MTTLKARLPTGEWVTLGALPDGSLYVQKTGDTMTGDLTVSNMLRVDTINKMVRIGASDSKVAVAIGSTYTPTWTGLVPGTTGAVNSATYFYVGMEDTASGNRSGFLSIEGEMVFGTAGATLPSGVTTVSLPPGYNINPVLSTGIQPLGQVAYVDASAAIQAQGSLTPTSTTAFRLRQYVVTGTMITATNLSATGPFAWATTDSILWHAVAPVIRV